MIQTFPNRPLRRVLLDPVDALLARLPAPVEERIRQRLGLDLFIVVATVVVFLRLAAVPVWIRLPFALGIVVWGAWTNRHWTVPISILLAMPILWINVFTLLLAIVPLRDEPGLTPARAWLLRERLLPQTITPKPATLPQAG